jgi:Fe-S cluster biogenesis protein NfuA
MPTQIRAAVEKALQERVRPHLALHGGDIELADVKDGIATVKLKGMCLGCPMAQMTLANVVEKEIMAAVPQIKRVEIAIG